MKRVEISAEQIVGALLALPGERRVSILDSCGVGHLGSHLLIAGVDPVEVIRFDGDAVRSLSEFQEVLGRGCAAIFTLSYNFGRMLQGVTSTHENELNEPDIYA